MVSAALWCGVVCGGVYVSVVCVVTGGVYVSVCGVWWCLCLCCGVVVSAALWCGVVWHVVVSVSLCCV